MTISSLHQCLSFPAKTPIQVVRATLIALEKEPLVGTTQYGNYSILSGKLQEGQTQMVVKFFDRQDVGQHMIGQLLVISAIEGNKGLAGITIAEHKGTKQLKVDNRAQIIQQDTGAPQAPVAYQPPPTQAAAPYQPQVQQQPPQPVYQQHAVPDPLKESKRSLSRGAGCYVACYVLGLYAKREVKRRTGEEMSQDQFQAMVSSLFIASDRWQIARDFEPLDMSGPTPWEEAKTKLANAPVVTAFGQPLPPSRQHTPPPEPAQPAEDDVPF